MHSTIPDPEVLVGIAALGLTVTGFSGLISVLGRRSAGHWTDEERFLLNELITVSLAVTFASFLPILVGLLYQGAQALLVATFSVAFAHALVLVRGASRNFREGAAKPKMSNAVALFMLLGGLGLIATAFLASFSVIPGAAFLLVANLLWQLLVATIHFVLLLLGPGSRHQD